jgi:hypothetical protein
MAGRVGCTQQLKICREVMRRQFEAWREASMSVVMPWSVQAFVSIKTHF